MNKASCCASCLCTGCSCWDEEQVLLLTQVLVAKFFVPLIYGFLWEPWTCMVVPDSGVVRACSWVLGGLQANPSKCSCDTCEGDF